MSGPPVNVLCWPLESYAALAQPACFQRPPIPFTNGSIPVHLRQQAGGQCPSTENARTLCDLTEILGPLASGDTRAKEVTTIVVLNDYAARRPAARRHQCPRRHAVAASNLRSTQRKTPGSDISMCENLGLWTTTATKTTTTVRHRRIRSRMSSILHMLQMPLRCSIRHAPTCNTGTRVSVA